MHRHIALIVLLTAAVMVCGTSASPAARPVKKSSTVQYEIELRLPDALGVFIARQLGLAGAQPWKMTYDVSPEVYQQLVLAGFDCRITRGVTDIVVKRETADASITGSASVASSVPGETYLDSGNVYVDIPDGTGSTLYFSMTETEAPSWATVTNVEFSTLVEGYGEYGFSCWDFTLALFHGSPGEDYVFWWNYGDLFDGSDDDFDDDPEDDWDIYIDANTTDQFNGEDANGDWGISCTDSLEGDAGWMTYLRLRIYWEAGDPPDPDIRISPSQLDFVFQEGGVTSTAAASSSGDGNVEVTSTGAATVVADTASAPVRVNPKTEPVAGKVLVRLKPGTSLKTTGLDGIAPSTTSSTLNAIMRKHKAGKARKTFKSGGLASLGVVTVTFDDETPVEDIIEELSADPDVLYAEPIYKRHISAVPTDSSYSLQWAYQNTQAEDAWDLETGDPSIIVAVIDSGVDWDHPDLAANIWENTTETNGLPGVDDDGNGYVDDFRGWDTYDDDNDPMDTHGHGTHVAGIAAGVTNNTKSGYNTAGTAWNCTIMAIRAGHDEFTDEDLFEAIDYAVDNGAQIINMSMGGPDSSQTFENVMDAAYNAGVVLVAAAGNEYGLITSYPAAFDSVIGVAATDEDDYVADFSNYGTWVDLSAPGVSILSTLWDDDYDYWDGTSMSCPFVAGAAALVLSLDPGLTNEQVRSIIVSNTDNIDGINPGYGGQIGSGRLNLFKALDAVQTEGWPREVFTIYNDGTGDLDVASIEQRYGKSWLYSISPTSTTVPESGSRNISVTVNPVGLAPGFTDSEILDITSNDADEPVVSLVVTVTVLTPEVTILGIVRRTDMDAVTLTFSTQQDHVYNVYYSNEPYSSAMSWYVAAAGIMGSTGTSQWTDTGLTTGGAPSTADHRSYKIQDATAD